MSWRARRSLRSIPAVDQRIRDAIERLLARQGSNGSFGLWSTGGDDVWLDAYVTDFLTRAREKNFAVPDVAFKLAIDRLRNYVGNAKEPEKDGGRELAYALYVLARNGVAPIGDLRYLADTKLDDLATPIAKAQIAAALAMLGDRARAERVYTAALGLDPGAAEARTGPHRLRLGVARRRRARDAGVGRRGAAADHHQRGAAHRGRARPLHLHVDARAGLADAGGARARQGHGSDARCLRRGAARLVLSALAGRGAFGQSAEGHQYRRRRGAGGGVGHRRADRRRSRRRSAASRSSGSTTRSTANAPTRPRRSRTSASRSCSRSPSRSRSSPA